MNDEEIGFLALSQKDYQEAIPLFQRALERKKEARSYYGLGLAYLHLENIQKARWAFHKALEIEPNYNDALLSLRSLSNLQDKVVSSSPPSSEVRFKIGSDYFEINQEGRWSKIFFKGMNLGLGLPGHFPGEFPIEKGTYLKWFEKIYELGANCLRIYTLHPPSFYEAFYQFNQPKPRLYLFQGIWVELPRKNHFYDEDYLKTVKEKIRNTIDAIHGNIELAEKPGEASGSYRFNLSPYTAAFIFGREWESCSVKGFNERGRRNVKDYRGACLFIEEGTPFEIWVTEMADYLQHYEEEKYSHSHPVSVVNWPTLDPLIHPVESTYEANMEMQGIKVPATLCHENEDEEVLDLSKIKSLRGGGFFATYHIYPYYPDFMVNEFLEEENPYLAYLLRLKRHHQSQPILIGEFGVPSSREIAHWHPRGWHHGGHSETQQGEVNGQLIQTLYRAKMAGGILFSWFDEWYKKNWLFLPYYHPPDRKSLWFNIQDAEENYGLLGAYPGYPRKKVRLIGSEEDWREATLLYEKSDDRMVFPFNDGFDEARLLKRVRVQHDEGFLYLLIETKGRIDFSKAHYLVGLDTLSPERGEFRLPLNTNVTLPIGIEFLIHLAGRDRSRILICKDYDKYLNSERGEIRPLVADQGEWVLIQHRSNIRRLSKDGKRFFPSRVHCLSRLRYGSLEPKHPSYDSLADFYFIDNRMEIRIPWSLLHFTDPSSRRVLWKEKDQWWKKTDGIHLLLFSYRPEGDRLVAKKTGLHVNITDSFPFTLKREEIRKYSWEEWETPVYHTYLKESYSLYQKALRNIPERIE
jgi:tetratricopeptide (TPR) repeat protein